MEIEKVIDILEIIKQDVAQDGAEACDMAIQALEKQIGRVPVGDCEDVLLCPCCYEIIISDEEGIIKYCSSCGQKIDWSN